MVSPIGTDEANWPRPKGLIWVGAGAGRSVRQALRAQSVADHIGPHLR